MLRQARIPEKFCCGRQGLNPQKRCIPGKCGPPMKHLIQILDFCSILFAWSRSEPWPRPEAFGDGRIIPCGASLRWVNQFVGIIASMIPEGVLDGEVCDWRESRQCCRRP